MVSGVQVGLLGLGVVGTGVLQACAERSATIAARCGRPLAIKRALVRDVGKARPAAAAGITTTNPADVLADPEIAVVIEVLGGEQPAYDYARRALLAGKHLVTANKEMLAKHGPELLALAHERGLVVGFEASVGGGIPIVAALRRSLLANRVTGVRGIVNGTTNYILTEMNDRGREFAAALREAQALGYAEPDPTNDVEGFDSRYKLTILCALAFGVWPRPETIACEGITRLEPADFRLARALGYAIKLLAHGRQTEAGLEAWVSPALVPAASLLAGVRDVFNAIQVEGDMVGDMLFYGRGAGPAPTASAILADVMDIVRGERPPSVELTGTARLASAAERAGAFYLRLETDGPAVAASAGARLRELGVGVAASAATAGALGLVMAKVPHREVRRAADELAAVAGIKRVAALLPVAD